MNVWQYKPNVIASLQAHGTDLSFVVVIDGLQDWNVSQLSCELKKVLEFILPVIILNNGLNVKENMSWQDLDLLLIL